MPPPPPHPPSRLLHPLEHPDYLLLIFQHLSKPDLVTCLRVAFSFQHAAASILYRNLDFTPESIRPILRGKGVTYRLSSKQGHSLRRNFKAPLLTHSRVVTVHRHYSNDCARLNLHQTPAESLFPDVEVVRLRNLHGTDHDAWELYECLPRPRCPLLDAFHPHTLIFDHLPTLTAPYIPGYRALHNLPSSVCRLVVTVDIFSDPNFYSYPAGAPPPFLTALPTSVRQLFIILARPPAARPIPYPECPTFDGTYVNQILDILIEAHPELEIKLSDATCRVWKDDKRSVLVDLERLLRRRMGDLGPADDRQHRLKVVNWKEWSGGECAWLRGYGKARDISELKYHLEGTKFFCEGGYWPINKRDWRDEARA